MRCSQAARYGKSLPGEHSFFSGWTPQGWVLLEPTGEYETPKAQGWHSGQGQGRGLNPVSLLTGRDSPGVRFFGASASSPGR